MSVSVSDIVLFLIFAALVIYIFVLRAKLKAMDDGKSNHEKSQQNEQNAFLNQQNEQNEQNGQEICENFSIESEIVEEFTNMADDQEQDSFKIDRGLKQSQKVNFTTHFGIKLREKIGGHQLDRENYCKIDNKSSVIKDRIYSDEWCQKHYSNCMENFDLNMKYFSCLDKDDFNQAVLDFTNKNPFEEIENLNDYDEIPGYYLLVLDHYKQAYLGTTNNLKKRIMSHWSKTKKFDRLIFGNINSSIISIDSFRALDTTRIYINQDEVIFDKANFYINSFNSMFLSNRIDKGVIPGGLIDVTTIKRRNLK